MKRVSHADNMCDKAGRQAGRSLQVGLGEASALAGPGVEVDGKPPPAGPVISAEIPASAECRVMGSF